ncbi:MAG: ROK family protein [Candidatus Eremiobacteraeota bacterium]|nr:ROK family protein [Candidatus Eremiobacteraeota bacterium]
MRKAIGVDLGGSHVTAAVVSEDGKILSSHEQDLEDHAVDAVLQATEAMIDSALKDGEADGVVGIGIGSPGNIDLRNGSVVYSPNFQWENVPLGGRLSERFTQPIFVGNDARCATLGEYTYGTGRGTSNFVLLTLGTGVGGGIVADGDLILGNADGAGEIGHHQIRARDGFVCNCGKIGCFEAQASGTGLIRHAFAVRNSFPRSTLLDKKPEKLGSKAIRKAAQAGDRHALAAWQNFAEDLAIGVANVIAFVNPQLIALGGGVSSAGDFMIDSIRDRVDELTTMVPKRTTRVVIAQLGNDAGVVGAATMALRGGLKAPG